MGFHILQSAISMLLLSLTNIEKSASGCIKLPRCDKILIIKPNLIRCKMTDSVMIFQVIDMNFSSQALFKVLVDD